MTVGQGGSRHLLGRCELVSGRLAVLWWVSDIVRVVWGGLRR